MQPEGRWFVVDVIGCWWYWSAVRSQTLAYEVARRWNASFMEGEESATGESRERSSQPICFCAAQAYRTSRSPHSHSNFARDGMRPCASRSHYCMKRRLISKSELTSYMGVMAIVRAVKSVVCSPLIAAGVPKCVFGPRCGRWQAICWRICVASRQ